MGKSLIFGAIAVLALFTSALSDDVSDIEPFVFEDLINKTIEGLRPNISDPLLIENLEVVSPFDILNGSLKIANFNLTGLQGFQVTHLHFALIGMRLNFTVNFPAINLNTNYSADLVLANEIPLYGGGNINVHLDGFQIQGSGQADLSNGTKIKNLRIQLHLDGAVFDLHGLLNDEDLSLLISEILNDLTTKVVDENQELITVIISPIIETIINAILNNGNTTTAAPPIDVFSPQ